MNKNWLTAIAFSCITLSATSQTLFTYGTYKADASEFLKAFNKNNAVPAHTTGQQAAASQNKAMRDYLDMYIASRLKIREAYERGYDTLSQIKGEVDNLRAQVVENYMSDPDAITRLTKEAYQRSQKDIHAAHIFISINNSVGVTDTAAAKQKLNEVMARLDKGEDFLKVATELSDDPAAKTNHGDLNYITAFTLPYAFENVIYSMAPGKYSKPFASRAGYHIFKNLDERKAIGKIKLQQILLAFPPGIDEAGKTRIHHLADSLYQRILKGDDFGSLANQFSNDYVSAGTFGNMPETGVGQFDPAFEKLVFSLSKDGAVSAPYLSAYGYHIVKRVSRIPVVTSPGDKANNDALELKVKNDDRWKTAKDFIYARVQKKPGLKRASYNEAMLWELSDSLLNGRVGVNTNLSNTSTLFTIGETAYPVSQWIEYAQTYRYRPDRAGQRSYPEVMDDFEKNAMYKYYRDHLEDYNEDFRNQMNEFRDGNLFFEIMQREVWNKAQADSVALVQLYEKNKANYNWKESADAVIFFCNDVNTAKALQTELKKKPADWRKLSEHVVADSGRYEWTQLPATGKGAPQAGTIGALSINKTDNTASFAYIVKVYTKSSPRTYNEAKGLVMNDYQAILEETWMKELRKKYPVTIDQKVFDKISR